MVKMSDSVPDRNQQKLLDKKLDKCRNPDNNPDSEMYLNTINYTNEFTKLIYYFMYIQI